MVAWFEVDHRFEQVPAMMPIPSDTDTFTEGGGGREEDEARRMGRRRERGKADLHSE